MEVFAAIGFLLFTVMPSASLQEHKIVRRFAGDWNWNGQLSAGQANNVQTAWTKGDTANRGEQWSADDVQQKQEGDDDIVWNTHPQGNDKGGGGGGDLSVLLRGVPGVDFPDFTAVPDTAFECPQPGYYADVEAGCQVFHICHGGRKDSFLCPLGTIFNQHHLVCDWWFNVNCSESTALYDRDIFQEAVSTTTTTSTTTEKPQMPWSAQDLDRKRPPVATKGGWPGKQNPASVGKRGGKKSSDVASQAVNSWSRTDVQQKEVTHSWSSSSTLGNYGSPSAWNSEQHSTRPVWYGIDGQPAKDQTDPMKKRSGLLPSSKAPFGTRMFKSDDLGTSSFHPTTSPNSIRQTTTPRKATTAALHRTSIVPASGVTGVWVQDTTSEVLAHRKAETWDHRQRGDRMDASATVARASWRKLRKGRKRVNDIQRRSFVEKRVSLMS